MKILFVLHQFMPEYASGTETVTYRLAKAAQRSGHSVIVLTCSMHELASWRGITPEGLRWTSVNGVPVYAIPEALVSDPYGFTPEVHAEPAYALRQFIARHNVDVCHIVHLFRMISVALVMRELNIPYVVTLTDFFTICHRINYILPSGEQCHGSLRGYHCELDCNIPEKSDTIRQAFLRDLLEGAAVRVTCSNFIRDIFVREFPNIGIRVMAHGTDFLKFSKKIYNGDLDEMVFGYLGTVSKEKGVDVLLRAFIHANVPGTKLVIAGPAYGNIEIEDSVKRASENDRRIILRGPVPASEVPDVLAEFDVLCIPSNWPETFCLVLHEGFAAGLPAIVSDLGHPPEVVGSLGCGLVAKAGDVRAWSDAIENTAKQRKQLQLWQEKIPTLTCIEEEAFFYELLYRNAINFLE